MGITLSEVEERFEDAAYTLKHVRVERGSRGYGSSWPDVVRSAFTAYGEDAARPMRIVPSAASISKMEECIDWLRFVEGDVARIIWLKAEGVQWRHICIRSGMVRQTAWRKWVAGLQTIVNHLNAAERAAARKARRMNGRPPA